MFYRTVHILIYYATALYFYIIYTIFKFLNRVRDKVFYNCEYLWYGFRENFIGDKFRWLNYEDDVKLREYFTKESIFENLVKSSLSDKALKFVKAFLFFLGKTRKVVRNHNSLVNPYINYYTRSRGSVNIGPLNIRIEAKRAISSFKKKWRRLSITNRLTIVNEFKKIFSNKFNTELKFDYKRLIVDPNFSSYYYVRTFESDKLDLLISMGLKYNKYLYYIYMADLEMEMYPMGLKDNMEKGSYTLISSFSEYLHHLDNLLFQGNGAAIFYHKDIGSDFVIWDTPKGQEEQFFIIEGTP